MRKHWKKFIIVSVLISCLFVFASCDISSSSGATKLDILAQKEVADTLAASQSTPTDIDYSLERYNLIRRAYWVNGQQAKADALVCKVQKPLGYIVLFTGSTVVGQFIVDGKVSSLNSFLTPSFVDSYYSNGGVITTEMADVDGSYGENDGGIFFFTPDGHYHEWNDKYFYSDIPMEIKDPVIKYEVK